MHHDVASTEKSHINCALEDGFYTQGIGCLTNFKRNDHGGGRGCGPRREWESMSTGLTGRLEGSSRVKTIRSKCQSNERAHQGRVEAAWPAGW